MYWSSKRFRTRHKNLPRIESHWERTEKAACDYLKMRHKGGPGQPDCEDEENPKRRAEVKDYRRPLNAGDIKRILAREYYKNLEELVIVSCGPCTSNALKLAEQVPNLKLICNFCDTMKNEMNDRKSCVCDEDSDR